MPDFEVARISLLIELARPRKADGSMAPAEIEGIRSSLPARYFDIRVVKSGDPTDEDVEYSGVITQDTADDAPRELREQYPFKVFDPHDYLERRPDKSREPDRTNEWVVFYREGDKAGHALVLGTDDVAAAIARVREDHASSRIWAAGQIEPDQDDDTPMGYLDRYDEILVVGGGKLQNEPDRPPKGKAS